MRYFVRVLTKEGAGVEGFFSFGFGRPRGMNQVPELRKVMPLIAHIWPLVQVSIKEKAFVKLSEKIAFLDPCPPVVGDAFLPVEGAR